MRLLLILYALFLFALPLYAQQSYREFEQELNLSEYQRAQVDSIKRKYMNEWRALNDESARKRIELRELLPIPAGPEGEGGKAGKGSVPDRGFKAAPVSQLPGRDIDGFYQ